MSTALTVGSLFSGIGGFDLGLERAGMRVIWQSEIDPYASAVLAKHWPGIPNHGDIRSIRARGVERPDVLCGGFPCQDISNAGKRAGIDGERSGLWNEFARVVGELRPDYVLVENVAALLGRGIERVLGDLAALGFDAEWHCIPASAVGAPHRRDRVWIIAYARQLRLDAWRSEQSLQRLGAFGETPLADSRREHEFGCNGEVRNMADTLLTRLPNWCTDENEGRQSIERSGNEWWRVEPDVGRVAHGVSRRVDRLRCLGNAIVPQVAEVIGRAVVNTYRQAA